ncbi:hypothetical protein EV128_12520 [Rhizobium azibense]|nr:hypothetical protein EV128_12520 [Rhizobium azibense]
MASMPSISINKETLALVTGCIAVCSTAFGIYNWLLSGRAENAPIVRELVQSISEAGKVQAVKDQEQDIRLDRTDQDRDRNTEALKEQTQETQKLKEAVVRLTTVIENSPTKKAEYYFEMGPVRPGAQTIEVRR